MLSTPPCVRGGGPVLTQVGAAGVGWMILGFELLRIRMCRLPHNQASSPLSSGSCSRAHCDTITGQGCDTAGNTTDSWALTGLFSISIPLEGNGEYSKHRWSVRKRLINKMYCDFYLNVLAGTSHIYIPPTGLSKSCHNSSLTAVPPHSPPLVGLILSLLQEVAAFDLSDVPRTSSHSSSAYQHQMGSVAAFLKACSQGCRLLLWRWGWRNEIFMSQPPLSQQKTTPCHGECANLFVTVIKPH